MDRQTISALISIGVAVSVLVASFFSWADTTWAGGLKAKAWPRALFALSITALLASGALLLTASKPSSSNPQLTITRGTGEDQQAFADRVNASIHDACTKTGARRVQVRTEEQFSGSADDRFYNC